MKLKLSDLKKAGFDGSTKSGSGYKVRCTECVALVINGVPTHELGCNNKPKKRRR